MRVDTLEKTRSVIGTVYPQYESKMSTPLTASMVNSWEKFKETVHLSPQLGIWM